LEDHELLDLGKGLLVLLQKPVTDRNVGEFTSDSLNFGSQRDTVTYRAIEDRAES